MADYEQLFGSEVLTKDGLVPTSSLKGKVVGIYFSAHWCPPCRMFTPQLRKIYLELKKQGVNFEIVFCSFDRSIADFNEYYGTMPWMAIPFTSQTAIEALSDKYGVNSIPTLLLLDEASGVYNFNGRNAVLNNPAGFPWK